MLVKLLKERKEKLTDLKYSYESFLEKAPEGSLRITSSHGIPYYYQTLGSGRKRLSFNNDRILIENLARKDYFRKTYEYITAELELVDSLLEMKANESLGKNYENMHPARKALLDPVELTNKSKLDQWIHLETPDCKPEEGKYYIPTARGELVRSKNEYLIANSLYKYKIPYKYEFPYKAVNGKVLHPDFYVYNKNTGQSFYWEHFGMMDDPDYVINNMMYKLRLFAMDNIFPGRNLIATFSGGIYELSIKSIERIIKEFLL